MNRSLRHQHAVDIPLRDTRHVQYRRDIRIRFGSEHSTMLVISRTQMQVMTEQAVWQFVESLVDELPREHPWLVLGRSRADLVELCRSLVDKGRDLGLSHRADLHGFVVVSLLVGPDFHEHPAIAEVLRGDEVAAGRKMYVVTSALLQARQTGGQQP